MGKRILLIGYNYYPELTGIGKYSAEMMHWLAKQGHECSVITTYPYYPQWRVQEPYRKKRFWYSNEIQKMDSGERIRVYRCPMYIPTHPSGLKRMLLDLTFFVSVFFQIVRLLPQKKYDYVLTVAPSFQIGLIGHLYKKLRKAKHIYHIQDLQIEIARDLEMIKSPKLLDVLFKLERFIMKESDTVSSISESMAAKIQEKTKKEVVLFPNWSNTELFFPIPDRDRLKKEFGFVPTDKIVLYSGGIGEKQGLESILYAAKKLKHAENLKFVICGTGPYKNKLQGMAHTMGLENVLFFPLQPHEKFNAFLNMADLHLVVQKTKTSDSVMPSKLNTILSVGGLALITANKASGLHDLVDKHKMGILVDAENQEAFNEGVMRALSINGEESRMTRNARIYAETYLSLNNVMKKFEDSALQD